MPDVSSAELVPNKNKNRLFLFSRRQPKIIIICQNSLPFFITSLRPWVELYQSSARDAFPSALRVLEPVAVTVDYIWTLYPEIEDGSRRLQTAPSGIGSLRLVQPVFTWLQIFQANHCFTLKLHCRPGHVQRQTSTWGLAFKESGVCFSVLFWSEFDIIGADTTPKTQA